MADMHREQTELMRDVIELQNKILQELQNHTDLLTELTAKKRRKKSHSASKV